MTAQMLQVPPVEHPAPLDPCAARAPKPKSHPVAVVVGKVHPVVKKVRHPLGFTPAQRLANDVSDYQTSVSPRAQRRAGRGVLIIKAAEALGNGGAFLYPERVRAAHADGLRVVHYHYLHWDIPGHSQALHLADRLKGLWLPGDRLMADIEAPLPGNEQGMRPVDVSVCEGWAAELHRQGHTGLIGYASRGWPHLRAIADTDAFAGWIIAEYGTFRRPTPIDQHAVGKAVIFGRQFTDGVVGPGPHYGPGISGPCDCSWLTTAGCKFLYNR